MCFFPSEFAIKDSFGNLKKIECGCGVCPECLKKKSRQWALRCYYESLESPAMMITLTYDNFVYDSRGKIIGERLPDKDLKVNKRDVQLFVKKLRKYIKTHTPDNPKIKYLITAEYGKTTHRPHYHAIIFGYVFEDIIFHKMSKRCNRIYRSKTLAKIWGNGICTVDCINITPAVAQYCTKYCSKDSGKQDDDTFMLFSRNIGTDGLLADFNGQRYIVEGQDYPIPRLIWQKWLLQKYEYIEDYAMNYETGEAIPFSFKYRSEKKYNCEIVDFYTEANLNARKIRDTDIVYNDYINFWSNKIDIIALTKPSIEERIKLLPNDKYHSYKTACLKYLNDKKQGKFAPYVPRKKYTQEQWLDKWKEFHKFEVKEFHTSKSIDNYDFYQRNACWITDGVDFFDRPIPVPFDSPDDIFSAPDGKVYTYEDYQNLRDWFYNKKHLRLSTCCISANDTTKVNFDDFVRFARRCDLEDELTTPLKNAKKVDLRLIRKKNIKNA